jgi:hypothetical protein
MRISMRRAVLPQRATVAQMVPAQDSFDDPVRWMLDNAPIDDEPETEEERHAIVEVRADRARGVQPIPFEDGTKPRQNGFTAVRSPKACGSRSRRSRPATAR